MRFKLNWLPTGAIQKYSREAKKELSVEKPKLGIIYMKMKLILAANAIALCGAALAWESPSRFGVCSHLNRWEFPVVDQQLPIMKKAGIKYVRTDLDWAQVEPKEGEWNFSKWDAVLDEISAQNMEILPILPGAVPKRAAPAYKNLDKFETYLRKCVERYKDRIKAWEIYNEPNLKSFWGDNPNPAEYAKLLERAYKAIKSIDPELKVLYAGVSGVPIDYIEKTFEAGASKYFDIMNIHPYQHSNPEEKLPEEIKALKELMKKYGISEKPIWITEVGYSSAQECGVVCAEAFEAALEKLGLDYRKDGVCEVFDEKFGLGNNPIARAPEIMLPKAKKVRKISLEGIKNLDPQKNKILLLPVGEAFPKDYINDLLAYIGNGGTAMYIGGTPFFFYVTIENGKPVRKHSGEGALKDFHISVDQGWKISKNFPQMTDSLKAAKGFENLKLEGKLSTYFASDANLRENDKMIPIFYGKAKYDGGEFEAPLAAIYKFDSALKGNFVCMFSHIQKIVSEENQAKFVGRTMLLAYAGGVKTIFRYNFRSNENDNTRESHFGLVRRDLTPKKSYLAYKTLSQMLTESARDLKIESKDGAYIAEWSSENGEKTFALWTSRLKPVKIRLSVKGETITACDYLGNSAKAPRSGDNAIFTFKDGITYVSGAKSIDFK